MTDLVWTEQFTEFALSAVAHSTWAYFNPPDILRAVDQINSMGGRISGKEFNNLLDRLGATLGDLRTMMEHLGFIKKIPIQETYELTQEQNRPGFYSGKELGDVLKDTGIEGAPALDIVGHNFILHAREALPFACLLIPPGIPEEYLKQEIVNRYVFNQKLNSFKYDNLRRILDQSEIIKDSDSALIVHHAPPALTFYRIVSSYLFLASYKVGEKVHAGDLYREVDSLMPNRTEDYAVLGFKQFPIEGWGKHQAWMTLEAFAQVLHVGLVDPICIARVLEVVWHDKGNHSRDLARSAAKMLKEAILRDVKQFRGNPVNLAEILLEFKWSDTIE